MKKIIFKSLILSSVCMLALPVAAQRFIDCSEGNAECDVLYASDEIFTTPVSSATGSVQTDEWTLLKTNDKPLAESRPVDTLPSGNQNGYRVVLPKGATQNVTIPNKQTNSRVDVLPDGSIRPATTEVATEAAPNGYRVVLPKGATQNVTVPNKRTNSRVDVLPDGSIQTTTVEITTDATPNGYQETTHRIERLDTEKQGAVWVEKSLADKVDYGDNAHDWEAAKGETLRSLLMQWGEVSGWTVVWKLDKDYKLEAGVVFRGTFTEVASAIIRTFARAVPAPIGTFYKGNRVLVVSIQEDENAH